MNTTARANNAADTTDEDAFADVNTQKNAASSSESESDHGICRAPVRSINAAGARWSQTE